MKKIISYLITAMMLMTLIPATAFASDDGCKHEWSEWEADSSLTCIDQMASRFCVNCDEWEEKELPATTPHNCVDWEIWDEATCTETGRMASYCEDCGELQEVEIPATGKHRWSEWSATPGSSCITGGEYERYCELCGEATETKPLKATGKHNWSGWLVWNEATVNNAGHQINYCKDCSVSKEKKINKIKSVKLSATKFTYNGKAKKPVVTVKDTAGKKLVKGTDYTVQYKNSKGKVVTNPTKAGKYRAVIKFKGKYRNTVTKNFTINPEGTAIKTVKAGNDSFTAKWNKKTVQVNGYQIRYSTSAKFTKGTTKYTLVKGNKTTDKTVKNLKNNKKYYVQIRTYKNDNGVKVYSGWSKTKSVKTR